MTSTDQVSPVRLFDFSPSMALQAVVKGGQTWFIASTACSALDLRNVSQAVSSLDDDERDAVFLSDVSRGTPRRVVINESGLYSLIFRSTKPEARKFQKWVTSVVLPCLRKDGLYIEAQEKPITDDLTLPELMEQIAAIQTKVDALNALKVRAWSRHQEEKEARRDAFRWLKGKAPKVRP